MKLLIALLLLPSLAHATIFVPRPLEDEIHETPTIVRGKVGASYADWSSDGSSNRIYTFYRLDVSESLKGDAKGLITIRELGGEKDGVGMQVAGAAHFSEGEDVVVFLGDKNDDGSFLVHGLSSGKFNLVHSDDGRECLSGVALAEDAGDDDSDHDSDHDDGRQNDSRCAWTLDRVRQVIRDSEPAQSSTQTERARPNPPASPVVRSSQAAPQLQPSPADEERGSSGGQRFWALAIASALVALFLLLRSRR